MGRISKARTVCKTNAKGTAPSNAVSNLTFFSKLKEKKLLGYNEANLPSKKSDNEASVQALNGFLTGILSREEVATSHYMNNFLQPLQLGDIKPK